ncbi:hypothetical protein [Lentzea sp. CC55]|uniref:hypothetical protein n=1 Tax=Lentzea sp. CC55 TaxID=2884909 RepID=UPI001F2F382E|nr:hypothetical protein [Lentzea sp. CC55]MCG8927427.1 hypothetical protein [Lentzea sp. CC55]
MLDLLRAAAERIDPPPSTVVEVGRAALSTRRIDEELAALIADSDLVPAGVVRDGAGDEPRLLVFETAGVTLEVHVEPDGGQLVLRGLVAGASGSVVIEAASGLRSAPIDAGGWFTVVGLVDGSARFRLRGDDGTPIVTSWVLI